MPRSSEPLRLTASKKTGTLASSCQQAVSREGDPSLECGGSPATPDLSL